MRMWLNTSPHPTLRNFWNPQYRCAKMEQRSFHVLKSNLKRFGAEHFDFVYRQNEEAGIRKYLQMVIEGIDCESE